MDGSGSATLTRDLRTGVTLWEVLPQVPLPARALEQSRSCDVAIVGAGITGALVAESLTAQGLDVVVLDRRRPGVGSTAASTALLQFEIDTPLSELRETLGRDHADRAWRRSLGAVGRLEKMVAEYAIDCAFAPRTALYLAGPERDARGLMTECAARRSIGLPSDFLDQQALHARAGINRPAALISEGAAEIDPVRFTNALLRLAAGRGAAIFSPETVAEVIATERGVTLGLESGREIGARRVVLATGYETAKGVPTDAHRITSTWVIVTPAQPERLWPHRNLVWEAADPYIYVRTTADGRVMAGGEDAEIADAKERDRLIPAKTSALERRLATLFPGIDTRPEFAWAGAFGVSDTGLPTIGEVPGMPGCFAAMGYGGNGITFGVLAAEIIARAITGEHDPDADIFGFR